MDVVVEDVTPLVFDDDRAPVRAASAVVPFGAGWLVAQDDATHAAWLRGDAVERVRVLPPVDGLETFEEAAGTKHLKPDLEGAFAVPGRRDAVVLLGSGSAPARTRAALVTAESARPRSCVADLGPLYAVAARALDVPLDVLNLEGACVAGDVLRWFHGGAPGGGARAGTRLLATVDADDPTTPSLAVRLRLRW